MSALYTLLEQARAARLRLEAEQAQHASLYGGYKQLLEQRLSRAMTGDDEEVRALLKRYHAARRAL